MYLCLSSVFTLLLRMTFAVIQKPCQGNFEKFQESGALSLAAVFTSLLRIPFAVIQKLCQGHFEKFLESGESRFDGSEKDRYFLNIPKW